MNLGIVGSRKRNSFNDLILIKRKVIELRPSLIISGGCEIGADSFAEDLAVEFSISIKIFKPDLKCCITYYEFVNAYYARNKLIAEASDILIALVAKNRKGGTENTIKYFLKYKISNKLIIL